MNKISELSIERCAACTKEDFCFNDREGINLLVNLCCEINTLTCKGFRSGSYNEEKGE